MYTDPRGGHNKKTVNLLFFKKWSPEMAYVTGFIYADGAIEDVRKSSRTCYTLISSNDYDHLVKIRSALGSNHNIYKRGARMNTFPSGIRYLCKESYILKIGSKSIYDDLVLRGVTPRKSLTLTFPRIPNCYLSYFIRGYFEGDGCVMVSIEKGKRKPSIRVVFTCGSRKFLEKLNRVLNIASHSGIKNIINGDHAFQLKYQKYDSLKVLKFMYKNINKAPFLERKYNKYQSYLETL